MTLHRFFAFSLALASAFVSPLATAQEDDFSVEAELERIGDSQLVDGDLDSARALYQQMVDGLHFRNASSPTAQITLIVGLTKLGNVQVRLGDLEGAGAAYEEHLTLTRGFVAAEPGSFDRQGLLTVSLYQVGDVHFAKEQHGQALTFYREALALNRRLAAAQPNSADATYQVSVSLDKIGDVELTKGDRRAARPYFQESLDILRPLSKADPKSPQVHRDLVVTLMKMSEVTNDPSLPRQALEIALAMQKAGILAPGDIGMIDDLRKTVGR